MSQPSANRQVVGWLLGLTLAGVAVFGPGLYEWVRLSVMQWSLDRQLAQLAARREQLTQEQQRLESDPTYVEGLIRSTFKVAQPGEYVVPLDAPASRGDRR